MSKFFRLAKKPARESSRSKKRFSFVKISSQDLKVMLVTLIAVAGISYLIQINSLATKGYQIKELENRVAELSQENSDLQLDALSLQSMGAVKEKVDKLGLVASGKADYLQTTPVALAR
ncbi:MAG: hypothetical protein WCX08_05265 [Candidatus Buchananbacteria bacterium]